MVEATGESIYRTVLATKCSILPRHLLSIIMASFAQHWVLVLRIHANQIPAKKTYWKTKIPWGRGSVIAHWHQGSPGHTPTSPSCKNRFRANSGGKGKSQTGGGKGVRRKGKNRGKSPFFMFLRTIFFFRPSETFPCPHYLPLVSEDGPRCGRFYFVIKFREENKVTIQTKLSQFFFYLFTFLSSIRGFPGAIEGWKIKLTRT